MSEKHQKNGEAAIRVRMPDDFKAEVEGVAREMHIGVSALARLALGEYIKARRPEPTPNPEPKEAA